MSRTNCYIQYFLNQQKEYGSQPVFRGASWQKGYGHMGYGLGGLFRRLARAAIPLAKTGANALAKIALDTGANVWAMLSQGKVLKSLQNVLLIKQQRKQRKSCKPYTTV